MNSNVMNSSSSLSSSTYSLGSSSSSFSSSSTIGSLPSSSSSAVHDSSVNSFTCTGKTLCGLHPTEGPSWILETILSNHAPDSVAASLSTGVVKLYDPKTLSMQQNYKFGEGHIRSIAWANQQPVLFVGCSSTSSAMDQDRSHSNNSSSSSSSGTSRVPVLSMLDTRSPHPIATYNQIPMVTNNGYSSSIVSLAVSPDDNLLAIGAGTDINVYDLRLRSSSNSRSNNHSSSSSSSSSFSYHPQFGTMNPIVHYNECHAEEISQVSFHPVLPGHLLTAGDDGIVNILDTRIPTGEVDALTAVLPVGNSVKRFGYFGPSASMVYTITRTEGLILWSLGTASTIADFSGLHLQFIENNCVWTDLIDCYYDGSNHGSDQNLYCLVSGQQGELAMLNISVDNCDIEYEFVNNSVQKTYNGHKNVIRSCSWYSKDIVFTGGEDSFLCRWENTSTLNANNASSLTLSSPSPSSSSLPSKLVMKRDTGSTSLPSSAIMAGDGHHSFQKKNKNKFRSPKQQQRQQQRNPYGNNSDNENIDSDDDDNDV